MAVLKVTSFGGKIPRLPARALPADAGQQNENLLTTATEFRPLQGDVVVGDAPDGARTLYRLARRADGRLHEADGEGWMADVAEKSYVKGQINDDATELTVVTHDDGTQPPRMVDALGGDRLLGVPPPPKLAVSANVVDEFTAEEARNWVDGTLAPKLAQALIASLREDEQASRFRNGRTVAGPASLHGMEHYPAVPWMAVYVPPAQGAQRLDATWVQLAGGRIGYPIEMMPFWGRVDMDVLKEGLQRIESPKDGSQAFNDAQIQRLASSLAALFDPDGPALKAKRAEMDTVAQAFVRLLGRAPQAVGARPQEPQKPTVPEYEHDSGGIRP